MPLMKAVTASMAIGVGLLAVALLLTPAMNTVTSDTLSYHELDNGSAANVTDRLEIEAVDINETNGTVAMTNLQDLNETKKVLNVTDETVFDLSGEQLDVNMTEITENNTTAQYSVQYPPTFGFNSYAAIFFTNLDLLLALIGFLLIVWPLVAVIA